MASSREFVVLAVVIAVVLPMAAMATDHIVGDASGWTVNYEYDAWASGRTFYVGDTLVFQYKAGSHNVFGVNQTSYKNCDIPPANEARTTGNDTIPLSLAGKKWYICGVNDHCASKKMKLAITVLDSSPSPAPGPGSVPVPAAPAPAPNAAYGLASGYLLPMAGVAAIALLAA